MIKYLCLSIYSIIYLIVKALPYKTFTKRQTMLEKINFTFKLGNIFAIAPIIDFERLSIRRKCFYRIYATIYFVILLLIQIYSIYNLLRLRNTQADYDYPLSYFTEIIKDVIDLVNGFISIIGSAFWNMEKFKRLHKRCAQIEHCFPKTNNIFSRHYKKILLCNFLFCFSIIFSANYYWSMRVGFVTQTKYFIKYICIGIQQVQLSLAFSYIFFVYMHFRDLNELFKKQFSMKTNLLNQFVGKMYRKLWEIVEDINTVFSVQIFFSILANSILALHGMEVMGTSSWKYTEITMICIVSLSLLVVGMVSLIFITYTN